MFCQRDILHDQCFLRTHFETPSAPLLAARDRHLVGEERGLALQKNSELRTNSQRPIHSIEFKYSGLHERIETPIQMRIMGLLILS